jgi:hypothetical protein
VLHKPQKSQQGDLQRIAAPGTFAVQEAVTLLEAQSLPMPRTRPGSATNCPRWCENPENPLFLSIKSVQFQWITMNFPYDKLQFASMPSAIVCHHMPNFWTHPSACEGDTRLRAWAAECESESGDVFLPLKQWRCVRTPCASARLRDRLQRNFWNFYQVGLKAGFQTCKPRFQAILMDLAFWFWHILTGLSLSFPMLSTSCCMRQHQCCPRYAARDT